MKQQKKPSATIPAQAKTHSEHTIICHTCSSYTPSNSKDLWKSANLGKQRRKPIVNRTGKN